MKLPLRWTKNTLIFGGIAAWGLLLVSCVSVNRAVMAPPFVPGANFVGSKACTECHEDTTEHFGSASHARLALADGKVGDTGCEACHGAGSTHVKSGGGAGTIVNPGKSPEACFACHLDKRGEFSLPNAHPVLAGQVSCVDCHDVHEGSAIKGSGASMESVNESCAKCHTAQKGPFVFEHVAAKDGCVSCHNPHGSVNAKMLVARDNNLCLSCHLTAPPADAAAAGQISTSSHEAVHGSNANNHLRY
jgi:predicted CXXCH cytochrome family protein